MSDHIAAKTGIAEEAVPLSNEKIELVLITGISGAGKSSAAKALEDLGFYCIDNLPVSLLRPLLMAPGEHVQGASRVAVVTDARAPGLVADLPRMLETIDRDKVDPFLLFMDTSDEVLLRRYTETRRRHPLASDGPVIDGIQVERELLTELRGHADRVMMTSDWTVHEVRAELIREFGGKAVAEEGMVVSLVSFGFKRGVPYGSDLMFDVRYLPNPHFVDGLREQTGLDAGVREFLDAQPAFGELEERLGELLEFLLPKFQAENRSYLSVSIGCTGGRHRSVAMVESLARRLEAGEWRVRASHRDAHL